MICKDCLAEIPDEEIIKYAASIRGKLSRKKSPRVQCKHHGVFLNGEGKCSMCEKWRKEKDENPGT